MTARPVLNASTWLALGFIAVFGYFDWIMHRSLVTTIVLCGCVAAVIVYRKAIIAALNLDETLAGIPAWLRPILAALPGLIYFLVRGQGTSGSGGIVFLSLALVIAANAFLGPTLDRSLTTFYRGRNRVLPRPVRVVLAIVLPVLVAFLVIHGSLSDLPAMFGGTTRHPKTPVGQEGAFLLGTLLSAAVAWLLLREGAAAPAAPAVSAARPAQPAPPMPPAPAAQPAPPVPPALWRPTHSTPPGGITAWAEPSPTAASQHVPGGLGLQVLARSGDWVQVRAENGWTAWVDGRQLAPAGAGQ